MVAMWRVVGVMTEERQGTERRRGERRWCLLMRNRGIDVRRVGEEEKRGDEERRETECCTVYCTVHIQNLP
jgi:hypothetical protein